MKGDILVFSKNRSNILVKFLVRYEKISDSSNYDIRVKPLASDIKAILNKEESQLFFTMRKAPPPPTSKPAMVNVVRALFNFEARNVDEMSFKEGDVVYLLDRSDPNWWTGRCGNSTGLVPSNYFQDGNHVETIDNPLHEASKSGQIDFLRECMANQISINGRDHADNTPLHWAARGGHVDCVEALLANNLCRTDLQNKLGDTPLHLAAFKGNSRVVELLLNKGASINARNKDKKLPYDLAKTPEVAAMLKSTVSIDAGDYLGDGGDSD